MFSILKPFIFNLDPETAHNLAIFPENDYADVKEILRLCSYPYNCTVSRQQHYTNQSIEERTSWEFFQQPNELPNCLDN